MPWEKGFNNKTVDWAELITLDLSEYEQPGGKESLVKKLEHAVRHVGKYISTLILIFFFRLLTVF